MNPKHLLHRRSECALATTDHGMNGFYDLHAATKNALERWENEGGKIPEPGFANDNDPAGSSSQG